MGELHFLRLFANHDEQHTSEEHTGGEKHVAVGKSLLHNECKDGDEAGESMDRGALL